MFVFRSASTKNPECKFRSSWVCYPRWQYLENNRNLWRSPSTENPQGFGRFSFCLGRGRSDSCQMQNLSWFHPNRWSKDSWYFKICENCTVEVDNFHWSYNRTNKSWSLQKRPFTAVVCFKMSITEAFHNQSITYSQTSDRNKLSSETSARQSATVSENLVKVMVETVHILKELRFTMTIAFAWWNLVEM